MTPTQPATAILPDEIGTANTPAEYRDFLAQPAPTTPTTRILWSQVLGGWLVQWSGFVHGGLHFRRDDAIAHAAELDAYPPEERAYWMAEHELDCRELNLWLDDHGFGMAVSS